MKLNLSTFFQIDRKFSTSSDLRGVVKRASRSVRHSEDTEFLLFLSTERQQSWFAASPIHLFCITDRLDNPGPKIQWQMDITEARQADIEIEHVSESTGYIKVGRHKRRLFSRRLFTDIPIKIRLKSLIGRAAGKK